MDASALYSKYHGIYDLMIWLVGHVRSLERFFVRTEYLHDNIRILDAGCGSGALTKALLRAAKKRGMGSIELFGFDLTPAMLDSYANWVKRRGHTNVHAAKADVLSIDKELPASWRNCDMVVSSGMLEYLPKHLFPQALKNLTLFLRPATGRMVIFISRKHRWNNFFIRRLWRAHIYTKEELAFAFQAAGLEKIRVRPFRLWGYVVEAGPISPPHSPTRLQKESS